MREIVKIYFWSLLWVLGVLTGCEDSGNDLVLSNGDEDSHANGDEDSHADGDEDSHADGDVEPEQETIVQPNYQPPFIPCLIRHVQLDDCLGFNRSCLDTYVSQDTLQEFSVVDEFCDGSIEACVLRTFDIYGHFLQDCMDYGCDGCIPDDEGYWGCPDGCDSILGHNLKYTEDGNLLFDGRWKDCGDGKKIAQDDGTQANRKSLHLTEVERIYPQCNIGSNYQLQSDGILCESRPDYEEHYYQFHWFYRQDGQLEKGEYCLPDYGHYSIFDYPQPCECEEENRRRCASFKYDDQGHLVRAINNCTPYLSSNSKMCINYTYDAMGRLATMTRDDQCELQMEDSLDQLCEEHVYDGQGRRLHSYAGGCNRFVWYRNYCEDITYTPLCEDQFCTVGEQAGCACPDGIVGTTICREDRSSWTDCDCSQADGDADLDEVEDDGDTLENYCPGTEETGMWVHPCCRINNPCHWDEDGMCDCYSTCPWDSIDCSL